LKLEFNFKQSAVIPYRIINGEIQVLLITSVKKKKWILPKGFIEFNHSPFESGKKEAFEEAGVLGTNETIELGAFKVQKEIGICYVRVFSMEVVNILDDYPEKDLRKRKWFSIKEAVDNVSTPELANLINILQKKLQSPEINY